MYIDMIILHIDMVISCLNIYYLEVSNGKRKMNIMNVIWKNGKIKFTTKK